MQVVESKSNTTPSAVKKEAQAPDDSRLVVARGNTDVSLTAFEASLCSLVSDVDAAYWDLFLQHRLTEIAVEGRYPCPANLAKGKRGCERKKRPQGGGGSPRAILGLQSRRPTGAGNAGLPRAWYATAVPDGHSGHRWPLDSPGRQTIDR